MSGIRVFIDFAIVLAFVQRLGRLLRTQVNGGDASP